MGKRHDAGVAGAEDSTAPPTYGIRVELLQLQLHRTSRRGFACSRPTQHAAPSSRRLRMIAAAAQCWQGMVRGSDDFSLLEEGRSKLLLASVPPGLGTAAEVAKRLTLWEECRFEDLLRRAEEQLFIHRKAGKRKKGDAQPDPPARADRARRTAAVGAYRKATTGLVSSMLSFEEKEDLARARELFPTSSLKGQAYSDPVLEPPPPPPGGDWDRPFAGLHYAALTAPASLALARNTLRTCSACLGGFTPTSSMRRCLPCSAGSPLARFPLLPAGSRARGSAGSARRTANPDPSRWRSFCARRGQTACQRASGHPPLQGPAHAPVEHQSAWRLRGPLPLARHHGTLGGQWHARAAGGGRPGSCQHVWQR